MWIHNFLNSVINKYISTYFEELDGRSIYFSLMKGNLELKGLKLKNNILNFINLPLVLVEGRINSLTIKYIGNNWYSFEAAIKGFHLVVELAPIDNDECFNQRHHFNQQSILQLLLEKAEFLENLKTETAKLDDSQKESSSGYIETVLRNLSISIEDIKITLIDKDRKNSKYNFTIYLDGFSVETTDSNWKKTVIKEKSDFLHKIARLSQFSVSYNVGDKQKTISTDKKVLEKNFLDPIDLIIKVIINDSRNQEKEVPKYKAEIVLSSLCVNFDVLHYHNIMDLYEKIDELHRIHSSTYFTESIRFFSPSQKWQYFTHKILNKNWSPMFKLYIHLVSLEKLSLEYKNLLILKYTTGKDLNLKQVNRLKNLEMMIPVNTMFQINKMINDKMKVKDKQEKSTSYMGYFSRIFKYSSDSSQPISLEEISCEKDVFPGLPDNFESFNLSNFSLEVYGQIEAFKVATSSDNLTKSLLSMEVGKLDYYFHYKPEFENKFKLTYSIFDIMIIGYENSESFYIINTNLHSKSNDIKFLSLSYSNTIKSKITKNQISLNLLDTNISIYLNYFITIRKLFYRVSLPSVKDIKNYAGEKMTNFSQKIIEFIQSTDQELILDITLNKTSLIFPCAKDYIMVARFDKLHFKTYISDQEISFLPILEPPSSEFKLNMVYLIIENFNVMCTQKPIFKLISKNELFYKMFLKQSIIHPVTILILFLENKDDSGVSRFCYSTYINIPELKIKLSFEKIILLNRIFHDTLDLFTGFQNQKSESITESIPQNKNSWNNYRQKEKILNVIFNIKKVSFGIRWNSFYDFHKISSNTFISELLFEFKDLSGEYAFLLREDKFNINIHSLILSHQIDNWIHIILRASDGLTIENTIIIDESLIADLNQSKKNVVIHQENLEINLHYNSMQNLVKFAEILLSITFYQNKSTVENQNLSVISEQKNESHLRFSITKNNVCLMIKHKQLFSMEISNLCTDSFYIENQFDFSISFSNYLLRYIDKKENLYNNLIEIPDKSKMNLKMNKKYCHGFESDFYIFEAEYNNAKYNLIFQSIETLKIWSSCLNEGNTAVNQARKMAYDTASQVTTAGDKKINITMNFKINSSKFYIPVQSTFPGGILLELSDMAAISEINLGTNPLTYKFELIFRENFISRFLLQNNKFISQKIMTIDMINAKVEIIKDDKINSFEPIKLDISSSEIYAYALPEDLVMLMRCFIENMNEVSSLNNDKNYTFFYIYWGNKDLNAMSKDKDFLQLSFQTNSLKIKILYSDEEIHKDFYQAIQSHEGHPELMDILFDNMKIHVAYRSYMKNIEVSVNSLSFNNLILLNESRRNSPFSDINQSKNRFLLANGVNINYENFEKENNISVILTESYIQLDIDMIKWLKSHILVIFGDYTIFSVRNAKSSENSNFFQIAFSEEFKLNRFESKYYLLFNIYLKNTHVFYDPEIDGKLNRKMSSTFYLNFSYEIKNGVCQNKIVIPTLPVDFISDNLLNISVKRNFLTLGSIYVQFCYTSNILSNFNLVIESINCHLSYKSLKLIKDIKNKYFPTLNTENTSKLSIASIKESCEDISQQNLFQPHSFSKYSQQLDETYDISALHVDQEVFARFNNGFYYQSKIITKYSSHLVVQITYMGLDYEISALDRLAIIPIVACSRKNILKNDVVLFKQINSFEYRLGQIMECSQSRFIIRSYMNYNLESVEINNVLKFPKSFLTHYRGVGLSIFGRYNDGNYYPAIVIKRKSFMLELEIHNSEVTHPRIAHRIVDDCSCAFMWDRFDSEHRLKPGDNILVLTRLDINYYGTVCRFYSEIDNFFLVKSFIHQKKQLVTSSDCLYLKPQVYGVQGLGSRYFCFNRDMILPILKNNIDITKCSYKNMENGVELSTEEVDKIFIDTQSNKNIIYPFQPVIIDNNSDESIRGGNILTLNVDGTYTVIQPDNSCKNFSLNDLIIQNPNIHIVKSLPVSLIEQEGSLCVNNIKMFVEAEIYTDQKPLFLINCVTSLKIFSWSKFETCLTVYLDLSSSYLNTEKLYWEPFIQFIPISNNKHRRNIKIKYTESSLEECSFLPEIENIVGTTPKNFKLHVLDEMNFTISELFFRSSRILYDDFYNISPELKPHNFFRSQFIVNNQTEINMEIILTTGLKFDKKILRLEKYEKIEFDSSMIDFNDLIGNQKIFTPFMFQKIPNTDIKIFKSLNKSSSTHYYFEYNSQIYSYIIDITIFDRIYQIIFRYPFKIMNLLEMPVIFKARKQSFEKYNVRVEANENKAIFLNYPGNFDFSLCLSEDKPSSKMSIIFSDTNFPLKYKYTLTRDDNNKFQCVCYIDYDEISTFSSSQLNTFYKPMFIVISPAITFKNDLEYCLSILMIFDGRRFNYEIESGKKRDILQLSEKRGKFTVNFLVKLHETLWEASQEFDLSSKLINIFLPFKPKTESIIGKIGFTIEKTFLRNFIVRIFSYYTFINQTKHNITVHLVKKNLTRDDVIIVPSNSNLAISPSNECEKCNITIDSSLKSDTFPLNVIGFQTYVSMKKSHKSDLFHNILISIERRNNFSIAIKFKSAVYFKNNLNHFLRILPKNYDIVNSIFLDKNSEMFAVLPLPTFPCDLIIHLEDHQNKYPITFSIVIGKSTILFTSLYDKYFSAKCFWKDNILNFEFDELKPETFDYVLINFSNLTLYCHHELKTSCLSSRQQVFFSKANIHDASTLTRFNFHPIIDASHPIIDFEALEEKVTQITTNKSKYYIAKFYDVRHTAFVVTENHNFALHCSDTISESTWISLYFKIVGFSFSVVSSMLSKELLLLSIFRNCDRWVLKNEDSSTYSLHTKECRELNILYEQYIKKNTKPLIEIKEKKMVDFSRMKYIEEKKISDLKFVPSFAVYLLLNISISSEIQNLSLKVDKIQIDCPSYDANNPIILCQTLKPASVQAQDPYDLNFIVASIFINRPVNYQTLGNRKYQNLDYFKILIQEFDICIDIPLVLTLANYVDYILFLICQIDTEMNARIAENKTENFKYLVKYFHLSPLKFNVNISSASMNEKLNRIELAESSNKMNFLNLITLMLVHIPLIDISKTSINLPCLNIENFEHLLTSSEIIEKSKFHYYSHLKRKFIKLLFNLKLTGNLVSSASQFAHGMRSFFYEPYQGVVRSNQLGKGFVLGVKGLYSGTIGTAVGALTSISDSIGKGLATLSFDSEHEDQRNKILKLREDDPLRGFAASSLGVFKGIGSGFMGLVTSPVEAFKEKNEVSDIFKGVGKGLAGFITKPLGGILDFTSSGLNLISRIGDSEGHIKPRRKERCFYFDDVIRPIDITEIQKYFLYTILTKNHRLIIDDKFVYGDIHEVNFNLITDRHVLSATCDYLLETQILFIRQIPSELEYNVSENKVNIIEKQIVDTKETRYIIYKFFFISEDRAKNFVEQLSRFECP